MNKEMITSKKVITIFLSVLILLTLGLSTYYSEEGQNLITGFATGIPQERQNNNQPTIPFATPIEEIQQPNIFDDLITEDNEQTNETTQNSTPLIRRRGGGGGGTVINTLPVWTPRYGRFKGGRNPIWEQFNDPSRVCNGDAILHIGGFGMIRWKGCVDARFADFDRDVEITGNNVSVNSFRMHNSFNSSAEITMEGLSFDYTPAIYRDGTICHAPQCKVISYQGGELVFEVNSFSSYTAGVNSQLDIWDETDLAKPYSGFTRYPNQTTQFFANYTNISDGQPVTGANCTINFTDVDAFMTYNTTKQLYEYNRTFNNPGFYEYNITCSESAFATLNTTDFSSILTQQANLTNVGPSGANITAGTSSRGTATSPDSLEALSGNVTLTSIVGNSITQAWQGYYGNITGAIRLTNAAGAVFYNWSIESPTGEVYASRSASVNFANVSCANNNEITNEESHLNIDTTDTDSITNTFNKLTHPAFHVGQTQFTANSCNATNLYNESGTQNTSFFEVLLSDNSGMIIYTALLENNIAGFNGGTHDFEMIVGEDGHASNTATTDYYFYVELY